MESFIGAKGIVDMRAFATDVWHPFLKKSDFDPRRIIAPYIGVLPSGCNELRIAAPYISKRNEYKVSMMTYSNLQSVNIAGIGHASREIGGEANLAELINSGGCLLNTFKYDNGYNPHILMAMACGLPVVTTPSGLLDRHLVNGINCFMVDEKDYWGIAEAIHKIMCNAKTATNLRISGLETFKKIRAENNVYANPIEIKPSTSTVEHDSPIDGEIKIVVYLGDFGGCGYYRARQPYEALAKAGYQVYITHIMRAMDIEWADVIVFQRQHQQEVHEGLDYAKSLGKKTIYELDDFLHGIPRSNPAIYHYPPGSKQLNSIIDFVKKCDVMTVSTPGMAGEYGRYANRIVVLQNTIDLSLFPENGNKDNKKIRIGWTGSSTHLDDIRLAIPAIEQVLEKYDNTEFAILGADYRSLFKESVRDRLTFDAGTFRKRNEDDANRDLMKRLKYDDANPNCVTDYYKKLALMGFDIGIAPIHDNRFNQAKSSIKVLEYSGLRIPAVASRVGEYQRFHEESDGACFLAKKHNDFVKKISRLVEDASLRKEMGDKSYDYVAEHRTVQSNMPNYDRLIRELYY